MQRHKTWWGEAFFEALISFIDEGRLTRGRAYRSDKRMLDFDITKGTVYATVKGNKKPWFGVYKDPKYEVQISFHKIPTKAWATIIEKISTNPGWLSKLMLNEVPDDIDQAFSSNNYTLLPTDFDDVSTSCSCPDYANPCKHIAGVYYKIAEILDSNPIILFEFRGCAMQDLQKELQKSDLGKAFAQQLASPQKVMLEISQKKYHELQPEDNKDISDASHFWSMPNKWSLDNDVHTQDTSASIIKKQGDYPSFWNKRNSFVESMEDIYKCIKTKNSKSLL